MKTFFFISGLPRSGSTLLSAILRQNPELYANVTSPVFMAVHAFLDAMNPNDPDTIFMTVEKKRRIIKGIFDAYYQEYEQPVIFDTSRGWTARLHLLKDIFPETKLIACVRDVGWVVDSYERMIAKNPTERVSYFPKGFQWDDIYQRVAFYMKPGNIVGAPLSALKAGLFGNERKRIMVVEYNHLAQHPDKVCEQIYRFLGLPVYQKHDFNNVEFNTIEYDAKIGQEGLHTVKKKVAYVERRTILPPDLFQRCNSATFWRKPMGSGIKDAQK